jgi:MraZ protein
VLALTILCAYSGAGGKKWSYLYKSGNLWGVFNLNLNSQVEDKPLFRGVSTINLDPKGRMAMPSRYRDLLMSQYDGRLVATIDIDEKCLLLYPIDQWEEIQGKLEKLSSFDPKSRRAQRMLIGHATDLEMDSSGRILLPQILRDRAELDKHVALVGQGKKFEIWSGQNWSDQTELWLSASGAEGELPAELLNLSL